MHKLSGSSIRKPNNSRMQNLSDSSMQKKKVKIEICVNKSVNSELVEGIKSK